MEETSTHTTTGIARIVIIGPESTGKSTLSEDLAAHFNTGWCPEYAREYLLRNGKEYNYEDLLKIARGQLALEDQLAQQLSTRLSPSPDKRIPFFIDTDMLVIKVWAEFVFDNCHQWVLDQIAKRKYDLYLLCHTDLPWVQDELREYPDLATREKLFRYYRDLLINQSVPWADIKGKPVERMERAIEAVEKLSGK